MTDETERIAEIESKLDALAEHLKGHAERIETLASLIEEMHGAWCLEVERVQRVLPDKPRVAVGPGSRVSWADPKDASNVAWGGTVEFVGLDRDGTTIAHVDFGGYGRRNLPVDDLIIGILT
jgi:hypothetical protein